MDVDIQQNNLSSEQSQTSISSDHLSHQNDIEDYIERRDNESSGGNRSLSTTSRDNVWAFFTHVADDTYQCRLCSNTYKAYNRVDANLRKHIGKTHKMEQYLFESQKKKDATSEEESVIEGSSDEENFSSEEQEQQQAQEKLNDIVDEQIFEDTITNDTPSGKIIFGIHLLLCCIRCLIVLIRKCYLINEYVRRQAKADKTMQSDELVVDFHIRWNTICAMLTKFIEHRRIIADITNTPEKITDLKRSKCDRLIATHALSARNYATIAPGKVAAFLCPYAKQYLTVSDLKKAETIRIQEYNEILRSEKLISSATTNNIAVSSSNAQQSMESSEGHMEKSIDYLLKICLVEKPPVHKTTNKRIVWTIQQELGYYAMTGTPKRNFQSY
ncbi:unnamed protein product [Rotaria sordida]|uniref:BED-type domain-containing protein n=2 Tax=Rotaria sordida TaxID=392033 RepID=A0A819DCY2_9BILA|nr:unnamed protein product [Rotaria sordida]CAF3833363.1 unnamed protein product [Rotaria sordida]